ncbi:hypothetical protein GGC65_002041 [Sphingopyxis sp. OAS728]|uniref:hypothetical protein n=1 Tax=Sphingopyxis sp. OAS728 TaxID=2663823 RepID=UPI00178A3544|nr:hypothetical protein [Sphingopyxis sp. OAS728]MBE1527585.1 hypothetical protein [Sphingopyxis sp. OAS728]
MSLFAAVALLATAPVASETPDPIVVTGTPVTEAEQRERAQEFIRRTGVAELRPVARWIAPICPRAIGVGDEVAAIVEQRVRDVAIAAGARVAKKGCSTNVAIAFASDGGDLTREMLRKSPKRLAELSPSERERVTNGDDAVRWWYSTQLQSRDAVSASTAPLPWIVGHSEGGGPVIQGAGPTLSHRGSSIVGTQAVRALTAATVVIDVERAKGTPLDSVASFAAMVAMAEMDGDPPPPGNSILALFDGEDDRRTLSDADRTLLRAIYSLPPDREAHQHRQRLVAAIAKPAGDD